MPYLNVTIMKTPFQNYICTQNITIIIRFIKYPIVIVVEDKEKARITCVTQ